MDRNFSFFDHPPLLRHTPGGSQQLSPQQHNALVHQSQYVGNLQGSPTPAPHQAIVHTPGLRQTESVHASTRSSLPQQRQDHAYRSSYSCQPASRPPTGFQTCAASQPPISQQGLEHGIIQTNSQHHGEPCSSDSNAPSLGVTQISYSQTLHSLPQPDRSIHGDTQAKHFRQFRQHQPRPCTPQSGNNEKAVQNLASERRALRIQVPFVQASHSPTHLTNVQSPVSHMNNVFTGGTSGVQGHGAIVSVTNRDGVHPENNHFQNQTNGTKAAQQSIHPLPVTSGLFGISPGVQMQHSTGCHQPSGQSATFGNFHSVIGGAMASSTAEDPGSVHQFQAPQPGEPLPSAYPWESSSNHGTAASQSTAHVGNHHQSVLSLAGESRTNHCIISPMGATSITSQGVGNGRPPISPGISMLATPLHANVTVNDIDHGVPTGRPMQPDSVIEGCHQRLAQVDFQRRRDPPKLMKKVRGNFPKKPTPSFMDARKMSTGIQGLGSQAHRDKGLISPANSASKRSTGFQSPVIGKGSRTEFRNSELARSDCPRIVPSANSSSGAEVVDVVQSGSHGRSDIQNVVCERLISDLHSNRPVQIEGSERTPRRVSCSVKTMNSSKIRNRRKGTNSKHGSTIPVHLRNPKKGRARVFRECPHCKAENHIRRSQCVKCKGPLPAGKRRRDGNPLYDRRNSAHKPSGVVTEKDSRPESAVMKEEPDVRAIIGK